MCFGLIGVGIVRLVLLMFVGKFVNEFGILDGSGWDL